MGAASTMWVEVEVSRKVWRKTYGVTDLDALQNVDLEVGERVTGRVTYEEPENEILEGEE